MKLQVTLCFLLELILIECIITLKSELYFSPFISAEPFQAPRHNTVGSKPDQRPVNAGTVHAVAALTGGKPAVAVTAAYKGKWLS